MFVGFAVHEFHQLSGMQAVLAKGGVVLSIWDWLAGVLLPTIFALAFFLIGWRWLRQFWMTRRVQRGICPACGYDLRATPDRCPECGTEILATDKRENERSE